MNLATTFEHLADEWRTHCEKVAGSSNMQDRLNHPAFRKLVDLGPAAVPLMMRELLNDDDAPWDFVLDEVTGTRCIDNPGDFDPEEVRQRRLHWWTQNQSRFPSRVQSAISS